MEQFLNIFVMDTVLSIQAANVGVVLDAGRISPLPFAAFAMEGLTDIQGRPVPQVDLAMLLHARTGHGTKVATLTRNGNELALRGDAFSFEATARGADITGLLTAEINAYLAQVAPIGLPQRQSPPSGASRTRLALKALIGNEVTLIAVNGNETVQEVAEWRPAAPGAQEGIVRIVDQSLYPGRHLRPSQTEPGTLGRAGQWAILVPQPDEQVHALIVDKVIGLQSLPCSRLFDVTLQSTGQGTWFAGDGPITKVFDIDALVRGTTGGPRLAEQETRTATTAARDAGPMRLQFEGIHISCGNVECVVPFGLAQAAISLDATTQLAPRASAAGPVPIVDASVLFGHATAATFRRHLLLTLPGNRPAIIAVDRLRLEPSNPDNRWMPLPPTSPILSALIDAVRLDTTTGAWLFRIRADIEPKRLPRIARASVGRATIGWTSEQTATSQVG